MLTREDMRGRILDLDCYRAKTSKHEGGPDDDRCFCYGLVDRMTEDYLPKCYECGAFAHNARPTERGRVMSGLSAADARGRVSAVRGGLSSAMRAVSVPRPDWRAAARSLLDAAQAANDLALRCLGEGLRAEAANGLPSDRAAPVGARSPGSQLAGVEAVVWDEFDSHKE